MKRKMNKGQSLFLRGLMLAFMLCMGAFFMPVTAYAGGGEYGEDGDSPAPASVDPAAVVERGAVPFTPDGQASVTDHATEGDGKEFYTFTTPDGNVFFLVIDSQRDSENVYFLNAVTEADLAALAEKTDGGSGDGSVSAIPEAETCICGEKCAAGRVDVSCPVCRNDLEGCTGRAAEAVPGEAGSAAAGEVPAAGSGKQEGSTAGMILILLAVAAVGGAGYYLKIYRPKHDLDDAEDLEDLLDDGEDAEAGGAETDEDGGYGTGEPGGYGGDEETGKNGGAGSPGEYGAYGDGSYGGQEMQGGTDSGDVPGTAAYDDYLDDDYPDDGPGREG